jgi:hypothetical protein
MKGQTRLEIWGVLAVAILSIVGDAPGQTIVYVDSTATGTNNGSSWQDAYCFLQDGLAAAAAASKPVEARVAQGLYKPDQGGGKTPGDRYASFELISGVTIIGGYAGLAEVDPNAQDPKSYITVLSGDLKGDDAQISDPWGFVTDPKRDENSEHVVSARTGGETGVIDGFVITGGNTLDGSGAGVYCNVGAVVANCVIGQNKVPCSYGSGGGIMMAGESPEIRNCEVIWNWAVNGGGIGLIQTNGLVKGCTIAHNRAQDSGGGCYVNLAATTTQGRIENCQISDNSAEDSGGGICCLRSWTKLVRCEVSRNSARAGGGCSYYAGINSQNSLTLEWCRLTENVASEDGGGIYFRGGQYSINPCLSLSNVVANGNVADSGGAIACYEAELNLVNSRFCGNKAKKGGALDGWSLYDCNVINCVFAGNVADYGGGICYGPIAQNSHCGAFTNSVVWGNIAKNGPQAALQQGACLTVAYCDVEGGQGKVYLETGTTLTWGDGCMDADPCFVAPGYWGSGLDPNVPVEPNKPDAVWVDGDYHLRADSPCIDKGDPKGDYTGQTDIDNKCRVVGKAINMGVDEEHCFPLTYSTYQDWIALGAPDCWCAPTCGNRYQCDGDADGVMSAFPFMYRVFTGDLAMIVGNWKKKLGDPTLDPCADVDHKDSGGITKYRVFVKDLAILVTNWKKKDAGLPGNCPRPE